ncbi:MAG: Flp family type IVb pilin [Colwellia sp.]|uniref:Flp family type IVb pilin n=1 Tax=Colwellia sp. TaxID=56799 RepID=UPI001DAA50F7|nr:Flp family type IVb pilin [Colwellia sp.]
MNKLTNSMKSFINDFIEDESGLTAVEYAIAGGLVVGGMVAAFVALGDNATDQITKLSCSAGGGTWTDGTAGTPTTPATPGTCS